MSDNKSDKYRTTSLFKKFKKHFIIGGGALLVIILIFTFINSGKVTKKKTKVKASDVFTAAKPMPISQSDIIAQRLNEYVVQQDSVNKQSAERMAVLESQVKQAQMEKEIAESQAAALNAKLAMLNSSAPKLSSKKNSSATVITAKSPQNLIIEDSIHSDTQDSDSEINNASANNSISGNQPNNLAGNQFYRNGKTLQADGTSTSLNKSAFSKTGKADQERIITTYIPSNTYVPGVLIASMAANTGGNANADPTPGLIRLTDMASLPNEFTSKLRSCRVGVSGWGDLSSERIKMRTTTLSCVLKNGKAIDIPIEGYVAGEDSKAGLKGMVISHSGTLAAKATLAGFVQGIGQIGQAVGQTQQITPLGGVVTTVDPNQAVTSGVGAGVSQAGQTLSQYYLNMLTQISPTVEAAAGRHVTVIFTKGVELKLPINDQGSPDKTPLPIN